VKETKEEEEEKLLNKNGKFEEKVRAVIGINAVHLPLHFTPALFSHDFMISRFPLKCDPILCERSRERKSGQIKDSIGE
jgi:hypothetical protein